MFWNGKTKCQNQFINGFFTQLHVFLPVREPEEVVFSVHEQIICRDTFLRGSRPPAPVGRLESRLAGWSLSDVPTERVHLSFLLQRALTHKFNALLPTEIYCHATRSVSRFGLWRQLKRDVQICRLRNKIELTSHSTYLSLVGCPVWLRK